MDNAAPNALHSKINICSRQEAFNCRKIRKIRRERMKRIKFWILSSRKIARICIILNRSMQISLAWRISSFVPAKNRIAKRNIVCASKKDKNAVNFAYVYNARTNKSMTKTIFGTNNNAVGSDTRFTSLMMRTKRNN